MINARFRPVMWFALAGDGPNGATRARELSLNFSFTADSIVAVRESESALLPSVFALQTKTGIDIGEYTTW